MDEVTYDHECENIIQHVCEELYHVPVPLKPVPVPSPPPPPPIPVSPKPIFFFPSGSRTPRSSSALSRSRPSVPPRYKRESQSNDLDPDTEKLLTELHTAVKAPTPTLLTHQVK